MFVGAYAAGLRPWYLTYICIYGAILYCVAANLLQYYSRGHISPGFLAVSIVLALFTVIAYMYCANVWKTRLELFSEYDGRYVSAQLRIASPVELSGGALRAEAAVISVDDKRYTVLGGFAKDRILLSVKGAESDAGAIDVVGDDKSIGCLSYGTVVMVRGRLYKPARQQNEYLFDYQLYMFSKGVSATVYADGADVSVISSPAAVNGFPINPIGAGINIRERIYRVFVRTYPPREAALISAIFLGKTDDLDESERNDFEAAGLLHLMAVSGLHIAIIAGLVTAITQKAGMGAKASAMISVATVLVFVFIAGFSASVVRAALMFGLASTAKLARRPYDLLSALGAALLIILTVNPMQVFSAGFLLSFSAVLSISLFSPFFQRLAARVRMPRAASEPVCVSLAVSAGCYPIQAALFHRFSTVSILSNLLCAPFVTGALASGAAAALTGLFIPPIAAIPAYMSTNFIWAIGHIASLTAAIPNALIRIGALSAPAFMIYYLSAGAIILWSDKPVAKPRYALVAVMICAIAALTVFRLANPDVRSNEMQVVFMDVGNSNAAYINIGGRYNIIVDAGGSAGYLAKERSSEVRLDEYLAGRGVRAIDIAIASHGDSDHIDGFWSVLEDVQLRRLMIPASVDAPLVELAQLAQSKGAQVLLCAAGDVVRIGDDAVIEVISPAAAPGAPGVFDEVGVPGVPVEAVESGATSVSGEVGAPVVYDRVGSPGVPVVFDAFDNKMVLGVAGEPDNDLCLVTRIVFGEMKALFCGDISAAAEAIIVGNVEAAGLASQLMSVPHHGSKYSSSELFIDAIRPGVAVASVGKNNYGHPAAGVIERYGRFGAGFLRTDLDGMVTVLCDKNGIIKTTSYNGDSNKLAWQR